MKAMNALFLIVLSCPAMAGTVYLSGNTPDRVLPECEGMVSTRFSEGQINVTFHQVKNCTHFDVVTSSYEPTDFPTQKLQGTSGNLGGEFMIPSRNLKLNAKFNARLDRKLGQNQVILLVRSSQGDGDSLVINLDAAPVPQPTATPLPTPVPAPTGRGSRWW